MHSNPSKRNTRNCPPFCLGKLSKISQNPETQATIIESNAAAYTVDALLNGALADVDTSAVDQAKKEAEAAKQKLAEAEGGYSTAKGQYLSVMQEDMLSGFLLTDAEHDMRLRFATVARKGLDSAKEVFAVLSEKYKLAKDGLDRLLSGIITTARAESDQTARSEILSEMADRQQESNTQKAGQFAEETVLMDQPSPVNVSIDGTTAGNDSIPLAQPDGSGIINEGTQGEGGYDAGDAGGAEGQSTVGTIVTFTQGSTIPDEVLKTKPLYSPDANKWMINGGRITVENGAWKYTDAQGISVTYINGYPDFKGSGHVKQEVDIGPFSNRSADFKIADQLAPNGPRDPLNTWHHYEDGRTLQEVNRRLHEMFTHRGGISIVKRREK